MARFAPNFAYTLSGSTLTLDAAAQEDARYIFYYSYADINQTSGHSHAKDVRGGGWAGGTSWTLSHRPDGDEKLLLVEDLGAAFWAMYRLDSGNGTFNAWIRPGRVEDAVFEWTGSAVAVPVGSWAFNNYRGAVMRLDPDDHDKLYLANFADDGGGYALYVYRYSISANTFTALMDETTALTEAPIPLDIAFGEDSGGSRIVWLLVSDALTYHGDGARDAVQAGVWKSVSGGAFSQVGTGHQYAYNSSNINALTTLNGMSYDASTGRLWVSHSETRPGAGDGSWLSYSDDDGATWTDVTAPVATINHFVLGALGFLEFKDGADFWLAQNWSGTGAYSSDGLSGRAPFNENTEAFSAITLDDFDSGKILMPWRSDHQKAVGWTTTLGRVTVSSNGGADWTEVTSPTADVMFSPRSGRTHPSNQYAVGISHDLFGTSYICWTPDYGTTWYQTTTGVAGVDGIALEFIP
jgi:hypothetical protein